MPRNILKNIRNISEAANASTTIPRKVLNPEDKEKKTAEQGILLLLGKRQAIVSNYEFF